MGDILPVLRAVVYETVLGGILILGPLALALEAASGAPLLPEGLQLVGFLLALLGGILWLWAAIVLVVAGRGTPLPLDPPLRLVAAGPYAWIRNPMHLGLAAFLVGEALLFRSLPLLAFVPAVTLALVLWEAPREERELESRFGERYAAYRGAVPAWLPRRQDLRRRVERIRTRIGRPAPARPPWMPR